MMRIKPVALGVMGKLFYHFAAKDMRSLGKHQYSILQVNMFWQTLSKLQRCIFVIFFQCLIECPLTHTISYLQCQFLLTINFTESGNVCYSTNEC